MPVITIDGMEPDDDPESVWEYHKEQRRLHSGPRRVTCPTCHEPGAITAAMRAAGIHCEACTRRTESGW